MATKLNHLRPALYALTVLALVGCQFVPLSPGSGDPPDRHPSDGASRAAVRKAYDEFDFTLCTGREACGIRQLAGIETDRSGSQDYEFNPRASMTNLDPEWLTGWDALPTTNRVQDVAIVWNALTLAKLRHSWLERCHSDYDKLDAALRERDQGVVSGIQKAQALDNRFAQITALMALRPGEKDGPSDSFVAGLQRWVGGQHALELALAKSFTAAGRDYLYPRHAPGDGFYNWARPRRDLAYERDVYCLEAYTRQGVGQTPGLPAISVGIAADSVRPVFTKQRIDELKRHREEARREARTSLPQPGKGALGKRDDLRVIEDAGRVVKVTDEGDTLVVESQVNESRREHANCVATDRVKSIRGGRVRYEQRCGRITIGSEIHHHVRIAKTDLPEADIAPGDTIGFVVKGEVDEKSSPRGGGTTRYDWTYQAVHLLWLEKADGKTRRWW